MTIPRLELLLLNLKLLTVVMAGGLAVLAYRSYRHGMDRSMRLLAGGLASICIGAAVSFVGAMAIGTAHELWLIESTFLFAGVALLFASLLIE